MQVFTRNKDGNVLLTEVTDRNAKTLLKHPTQKSVYDKQQKLFKRKCKTANCKKRR